MYMMCFYNIHPPPTTYYLPRPLPLPNPSQIVPLLFYFHVTPSVIPQHYQSGFPQETAICSEEASGQRLDL